MNPVEKDNNSKFGAALYRFLIEIKGLAATLPLVMQSLGDERLTALHRLEGLLEQEGEVSEVKSLGNTGQKNTEETTYLLPTEFFHDFKRKADLLNNFSAAAIIVPKSFLVAMVSQYDAFLGRLIRAVFYAQPNLLKNSQKQMTFADLLKFDSVSDAQAYVVEKEIEGVLRESHIKHFEWLESKLKTPLRKGLKVWPDFVELTERRNLFVHTDGQVSPQYIENCLSQKVILDSNCKVGTTLTINAEYFQRSFETLFEIATKLDQVIWRKLVPEEIVEADALLNSICYDLLREEKYSLANRLLSFALDLPKHGSLRTKLVFSINYAITLKLGGNADKLIDFMNSIDWPAYSLEFKLASFVLREEYDHAAEIMKQIGDNGPVQKGDYKDWPVFKDFRYSPQFLETYSTIFGDALEPVPPFSNDNLQNDNLENQKNLLIKELADSWSFAQTHSVIEQLNEYPNFSTTQLNKIVEAVISNNQINWILGDQDVYDFVHWVIKGRHDEIFPEYLDSLLDLLEEK